VKNNMETKLFIAGRIPSKKNSRRRIQRGTKVFDVPSKAYEEWNKDALVQIMLQKPTKGIARCEAHLIFYMPDKRKADLTNKAESVFDTLVDAGVIVDDSWQVVTPITLHGFYDKENPGVEVILKYDIDKTS